LNDCISIRGARTHNLKNVAVEIARGKLTVVTGVSGSGKSSLVFDTLYAEGQRRYVQSLSTYARLFLERVSRPEVDEISALPPALALRQRNSIRSARSTVGTVTEIADYLRLLYAAVGRTLCPQCASEVKRDTPQSAALEILASPGLWLFVAPFACPERSVERDLAYLVQNGYHRLWLDDTVVEAQAALDSGRALPRPLPVLVDRVRVNAEGDGARVREALERAFYLGGGRAEAICAQASNGAPIFLGQRFLFDRSFTCSRCAAQFPEPNPALFSPNSPLGACSACQGFGRTVEIDAEKVVPDQTLSLRQGAVAPWRTPAYHEMAEWMAECADEDGVRLDVPYAELTERERSWLWNGTPRARVGKPDTWFGISGFFHWLERRRYKPHVRILLAKYRKFVTCAACAGTRLKPEALNVRVGDRTIADASRMSIKELLRWLDGLTAIGETQRRAGAVLQELKNRVSCLEEIGLGYLTLERQARTLSGGETQRIHLASALGGGLTDVLYTLDEPTIGLHARDVRLLLNTLYRLRDLGNTVVVVEHDPAVIAGADYFLELGPGAGRRGGCLVGAGAAHKRPRRLKPHVPPRVLLMRALARERAGEPEHKNLRVVGARAHNLKNIDVTIPLCRLVCVTGVSGSGKSTLVDNVLYRNYVRTKGGSIDDVGECDRIEGFDQVREISHLSQDLGFRSSRSNPATYLKIYDEIRRIYASTEQARRFGLTARSFSFNLPGGRCERCQGIGVIPVEMYFIGDFQMTCEFCGGRRFKEHVLKVKYDGRSIDQTLKLTADEALSVFGTNPRIARGLKALSAVGLDYLELGQATSTLSGGEAQRLKLAGFLLDSNAGEASPTAGARKGQLFILDEPTNGLSSSDIAVLLRVLRHLVSDGNSLLVIEHNLELIAQADYVIDLGPDAGEAGGTVVASGPPLAIAACATSYTGQELRALLGLTGPEPAGVKSAPARRASKVAAHR
jgi:excinuclease ABC subunit A